MALPFYDRVIQHMIVNYKWSERGYCPIYARENATRMYEPYHILGGNDVATDLIEDLKGLPTEPQKKKEGVEDDT